MIYPSTKLQKFSCLVLFTVLTICAASSYPPDKFNICTRDRNTITRRINDNTHWDNITIRRRCDTFEAIRTRRRSTTVNSLVSGIHRGGSNSSSIDSTTDLDNRNSVSNDDERWRLELPSQLQKRRGSLHKILVPTGYYTTTPRSSTPTQQQQDQQQQKKMIFCEVYLLGTAHVSKDSCEDVTLLMDKVKPDVLFVELCNQRIAILDDDNINHNDKNIDGTADDGDTKSKSVSQQTKEIMDHNPDMSKTAALSSVLLSKIQGDYATKLNVKIGGEFQEAYRIAKLQQKEFLQSMEQYRYNQHMSMYQSSISTAPVPVSPPQPPYLHGCAVVLGDRPVRLTLLRTWESLSLFGKLKLLIALIVSSLKQPKEDELKEWIESIMNDPNNDILSKSIEELSRHFPTVKETIIAERDIFMSCKIMQTARVLGEAIKSDGKMRRIVAVVGAGHCPGICQHLGIESSFSYHDTDDEDSPNCFTKIEDALRSVIETKKFKVDGNPEMSSIISDITSIDIA